MYGVPQMKCVWWLVCAILSQSHSYETARILEGWLVGHTNCLYVSKKTEPLVRGEGLNTIKLDPAVAPGLFIGLLRWYHAHAARSSRLGGVS